MRKKFLKNAVCGAALFALTACSVQIKPPNDEISPQQSGASPENDAAMNQDLDLSSLQRHDNFIKFANEQEMDDFYKSKIAYDPEIKTDEIGKRSVVHKILDNDMSSISAVQKFDTVKIFNQNLFYISGKNVFIYKAYPANEASFIKKIAFELIPKTLYVKKDKLIILGDNGFKGNAKYSFLRIFDIKSIDQPKELAYFELQSETLEAVFTEDVMHLLGSRSLTAYSPGASLLPKNGGKASGLNLENPSFASIYAFDAIYRKPSMKDIYSIDLANLSKKVKSSHFVVDGQTLLADNGVYFLQDGSPNREFNEVNALAKVLKNEIRRSDWEKIGAILAEGGTGKNIQEKVFKVKEVLEARLSAAYSEGSLKEEQIKIDIEKLQSGYNEPRLSLDKFSLANDGVSYAGSIGLDGTNGQKSFIAQDEKGVLVLACLPNADQSGNKRYNLLLVPGDLSAADGKEEISLGGEAEGISLVGKRLYVSMRADADNLSVIDIGDRKEPRMLGKLDLPDENCLMQPENSSQMILLCKKPESSKDKSKQAINLYLYDVDQPSKPVLKGMQGLGGAMSDSGVFENNSLFAYSSQKKFLLFPVSVRNSSSGIFASKDFNGSVIYIVDGKGISMRGLLENNRPQDFIKKAYYYNEALYTFTDSQLTISSLKGLQGIKEFSLQ